MSLSTVIKGIVGEELKSTHVAFIAEVLTLDNEKTKAKIQPLGLIRGYGGAATKQAVLTNVHIARSARCKFTGAAFEVVTAENIWDDDADRMEETFTTPTPIAVGDLVLCICCDRNIDAALKGENSLPPVGCHNQSDCVIVAII